MNLFDIALGVLLILGGYKGFKKGFIKCLGGLASWIVSILIAINYNQALATYLDEKYDLLGFIGEKVARFFPFPNINLDTENISSSLASVLINDMSLPVFMKKSLMSNVEEVIASGAYIKADLQELISYGLAEMLLRGLSFLILFIAVGIIVKLLFELASSLLGVTILSPINRLAGLALGLFIYGAVAAIILQILSPIIFVYALQENRLAVLVQSSFLFNYCTELLDVLRGYIFG